MIAFNHVRAARELTFARTYLKEAGLAALPKSIRELLGYRTLQNVGRGITEARLGPRIVALMRALEQ